MACALAVPHELHVTCLSVYFFSLSMPHTLQASTLKDGTIHWIPLVTVSFVTWRGVDIKRTQFLGRLCFDVTVSDVERGRILFTQGRFHARMPIYRRMEGSEIGRYYSFDDRG